MSENITEHLNSEEREKLDGMIQEGVKVKLQQDSLSDTMKDIKKTIKDEFGISNKDSNTLMTHAKSMSFNELDSHSQKLLDLAEQLGYYKPDNEY